MKKHFIITLIILAILVGGGMFYRFYQNGTDERGATKLMQALETNTDIKQTKRLIRKSEDINQRDKSGQTALFYAVRNVESEEVIKQLLKAGAEVNIADNKGVTPLMVAVEHEHSLDIIKDIIEAGADVNAKDLEENTALLLAIKTGSPELVRLLLHNSADPDIINTKRNVVVEMLGNNDKFTADEKVDYRQALLVISILKNMENKNPLFQTQEK